ncbi:radical SAM protein [Thermococcus sp.]|uniref:radical SAM/SPASM domain-containing protein n=1 Tax=Thermococcus sp. TaxID=35749 RepID=UPI00260C01DD|nr:radical SAM protein [Thermococcus sp.]
MEKRVIGKPLLYGDGRVFFAFCPSSGGIFELEPGEFKALKENLPEVEELKKEMLEYDGEEYTIGDFISHLTSLGIELERLNAPAVVIFELTRNCNLNCKHCIVSAGKPLPNELTTEEWLKLVDEISDYAVRLTLTGGEPLVHPGFFRILERAKEKGLSIRLLTNGTLLEEHAEELGGLLDAKVDEVQVSLDGRKKTHDSIRGKGSYEKTIAGIKALVRENLPVSVAFTLIPENRGEALGLYREVAKLGIESFRIAWGLPAGRLREAVPYAEYLKTVGEVKRASEELGVPVSGGELGAPLEVKPESFYPCAAGTSQVFIASTGDVYPCLVLRYPFFRFGNVREEGLIGIWRKREWERLKRDLSGSDCAKCPLFKSCRGGCPGESLIYRGDYNAPSPACRVKLEKR